AGPARPGQGRALRPAPGRHLHQRGQPADQLAPPGGHRERAHGAGADRRVRVRVEAEGGGLMASNLIVEVLAGAVIGGTSILYAAVGESYTESAGVVNLGTEGGMLVGALAGYAIAAETGSPWIGAAAGA